LWHSYCETLLTLFNLKVDVCFASLLRGYDAGVTIDQRGDLRRNTLEPHTGRDRSDYI